jgi:hypothetical protein
MTGPEHWREAERLLDEFGQEVEAPGDAAALIVAVMHGAMVRAQVHATLALAAATALGREGSDGTMPSRDRAQWFAAAAEPAPKLSEMRQS